MFRSVLLLALLLATQASATTVYRTVDKDGNVQYSDRPDGGAAEALTLRVQRPANPPPIRTAAASTPAEQDESAADTGPTDAELREEAARKAEWRARNCETAKGRLERYTTSHRLYRPLPNGERQYLSADEIDEARSKAAADVKEWCD